MSKTPFADSVNFSGLPAVELEALQEKLDKARENIELPEYIQFDLDIDVPSDKPFEEALENAAESVGLTVEDVPVEVYNMFVDRTRHLIVTMRVYLRETPRVEFLRFGVDSNNTPLSKQELRQERHTLNLYQRQR